MQAAAKTALYSVQDRSILSLTKDSPLASAKAFIRSSMVSCYFSLPEISRIIFPSFIMIRRFPYRMASFMLCVTIRVIN